MSVLGACLTVLAVLCGVQQTFAGRTRPNWKRSAVTSSSTSSASLTGSHSKTMLSITLEGASIPIFLVDGTDASDIDIDAIQAVFANPRPLPQPIMPNSGDAPPPISLSGVTASRTTVTASQAAASSTNAGSNGNFCEFRCLQRVSCDPNSGLCSDTIFVAGSVYCRFFSGCPDGRPPFSMVYIPLNPFGRASAATAEVAVPKLVPTSMSADSTTVVTTGPPMAAGTAVATPTPSSTQASPSGGIITSTTRSGMVFELPELPESLKPFNIAGHGMKQASG